MNKLITIALVLSAAAQAHAGSRAGSAYVGNDHVASTAAAVGKSYQQANTGYYQARPLLPNTADCNSYVHDVYGQAGIDLPATSTRDLDNNINYQPIDEDDAEPGDIILEPGHMGIYTGDDEDGDPRGWQMGKSGAKELTWGENGDFSGEDPRYFRPLQTPDLEERIGDQLDEVFGTPGTGENDESTDESIDESIDDSAIYDGE
jgi:hypothetical protein